MFGNHCINTGWWFQTWMEYFPFHIWDNPSHWLIVKPPTRINRNICIIIIYYYINTILLYYIYMVSPRLSMCMNYPCWSIFIYVFLCCSMLWFMFIIVHLYVHCLWLSMSIRAHISKMIRTKCSRFISNHRCFEFLGGWEASPPTPITWGWLDGFFHPKKRTFPT